MGRKLMRVVAGGVGPALENEIAGANEVIFDELFRRCLFVGERMGRVCLPGSSEEGC